MASCNITRDEKGTVLLQGDLTLEHSDEILEVLLAAISESDTVFLQFQDVESIDLSFLQLMVSAYKTAEQKGRNLYLHNDIPELLAKRIADSGLTGIGSEQNNLQGQRIK